MKFKRVLSFSPRLTFEVGKDGNFYPPLRRLTGMSAQVRLEHPHIEVGEQAHLYGIAFAIFHQLLAVGAGPADDGINAVVRASIGHAAQVRAKALTLLKQSAGSIPARPELTRDDVLAMAPDELLKLAVDSEQFGLPRDYLIFCFLGVALHLVDASLCALQTRPSAAIDTALRASYCYHVAAHIGGRNILGEAIPSVRGGQAKRDRSERVATYACSLVEGKAYPSRAEAVRRIRDEVIQYALDTEKWQMSPLQADKTIASWLAARGLPR